MPTFQVRFDCNWSPRKVRMVSNQLIRDLKMYGGVRNVQPIEVVHLDPDTGQPPPRLHLKCFRNPFGNGRCDEEWFAEVMTPCPKCKQRQWVKKIPAEKVA